MAKAEIHETLNVDKDKLLDVILNYESYPLFVDGVKKIQVERKGAGHARVTYHVSMMKDLVYVLDLTEDRAAGKVSWKLVEGDAFKVNNGFWEVKSLGPGKTDVRYGLEVEFTFPAPGFIVNKLVKGSLPSMLKSFEKRAST